MDNEQCQTRIQKKKKCTAENAIPKHHHRCNFLKLNLNNCIEFNSSVKRSHCFILLVNVIIMCFNLIKKLMYYRNCTSIFLLKNSNYKQIIQFLFEKENAKFFHISQILHVFLLLLLLLLLDAELYKPRNIPLS